MELRVLNYFLMVAREENITRAAALLHVTQPTLSRQLMQLEEELGVRLFERNSHNVVLTDEGMLLKRRAQEILALTEKTRREIAREEENLSGVISIGSGELKNNEFLAGLAVEFRRQNPRVEFELYSGNADNIKERMEKGLLDIALLLEPVDIGKYEFLRMPGKEVFGLLVRKDSELAGLEAIRPQDILGQQVLLSGRELVRQELKGWLGDYYDQVQVAVSFNLIYNAAAMVEKGMGVAFSIELDSIYKNLVFKPLFPPVECGAVMVWKKNQTFSPVTAAFLRYARAYVKNH